MGDRTAIAAIRVGLRIVVRRGDRLECCNTLREWEAGGLMGRPFFTGYCESCFTLFLNRSTLPELRKYLAGETQRG